jgi:hypothetical protein
MGIILCSIGIQRVYVYDIVITGDDNVEISRLKVRLSKEFEVKDLGQLKYFWILRLQDPLKWQFLLSKNMYWICLMRLVCLGVKLLQLLLSKITNCVQLRDPIDRENYAACSLTHLFLSNKT